MRSYSLNKTSLAIALCIWALLVAADLRGSFEQLDRMFWDKVQGSGFTGMERHAREGIDRGDERIVIVAIDDASIQAVGPYPWKRRVYAKLLDRLRAEGTRAAALGLLLTEPSSKKEDAALVEAARKWGPRLVLDVDTYVEARWRYPFPELKAAASSFGTSVDFPDSDSVVRRAILFRGPRGVSRWRRAEWDRDPARLPALGLKLLSVFEGKEAERYLEGRSGKERNIVWLNFRGQQKPLRFLDQKGGKPAAGGFDMEHGIMRVSAKSVLDGELGFYEHKALKGAMALIGFTAEESTKERVQAPGAVIPRIQLQAELIDNLLHAREFKPASRGLSALVLLVLCLLSVLALEAGPVAGLVLVVAAYFTSFFVGHWIMSRQGSVLSQTLCALAIVVPFLAALARRTLVERREKKFIRETFGQYVAPDVVSALLADPSKLKLGGEARDMTVMFLDIANFTSITEEMRDAEHLVFFVNYYLSALTDIIYKHRGLVDKYIGDCIMAFWNAPLDEPAHRAYACLAALECQAALAKLNAEYPRPLSQKPSLRIGLNSGTMVAGNTGSAHKKAYTVLGDEVNLASRLESANKTLRSKIMASEDCINGARGIVEARELGWLRVVGRIKPVRVFEPLGRKDRRGDAWSKALPLFEEGIRRHQEGIGLASILKNAEAVAAFGRAREAFSGVLAVIPDDGPSQWYLYRCEELIKAPEQSVDSLITLKEK